MPDIAEALRVDYRAISPMQPDYENELRTAFSFLRRHGRYTSAALNRILQAADRAEEARTQNGRQAPQGCPVLITAGQESRYDEMTEVKYGGMVGVAVLFPDDGRLLLAVHRDHRRQGVGSSLVGYLFPRYSRFTMPVAWVGGRNQEGQMFLLSRGWQVQSVNAAGAVAYGPGAADAEENDFYEDDAPVLADRYLEEPLRGAAQRMRARLMRGPEPGGVPNDRLEPPGNAWEPYGYDDEPDEDL